MRLSIEDLKSWDRFKRANLINSLSGYKSAHLIGTYHGDGTANLGIFSNIVHLGANPALIGFVNRPIEAAPHTIQNIERSGYYSLNTIPANYIQQAHQTAAKYPENISEFEACGFTVELTDESRAPLVKESPLKYLCELVEIVPIKFNNTFFVIGAVKTIWLPEEVIATDGFIHHEEMQTVCTLGIDGYYLPQLLNRFSYAKVGQAAESLLNKNRD
jgi:flavin reductase (DIM6/NTAB) family NADH-FMN oxidoreductase RutF